jgi:hypothetical protein
VPVREVKVTVRSVKPDLLHPGSQTYLVYQGPIPKSDRPTLVATVLYYLLIFAFTNFPFAAIFTAFNITHSTWGLGPKYRE